MSRALRGSPVVSLETRKRIEEIARQLNYRVDKNASNLRSQHSNTLALLLFEDPTPDDSQINPFFLSMLGSITRAFGAPGLRPADLVSAAVARLAAGLRRQPQGRRHHPARLRRLRGIPAAARASWSSRARTSCAGARCSRTNPGSRGLRQLPGRLRVTRHLLARGRARSHFSARHQPLPGILRSLSRL